MRPPEAQPERRFVVATPGRSVCDENARALEGIGRLRFIALGTRRGTAGVPRERTRLAPWFGLLDFAAHTLFSPGAAESLRFRLNPWFDHWVKRQLRPGDRIISSYGYANDCFQWVRAHGGRTFLDGGNSHPAHARELLEEEHRRWNLPYPTAARHHHQRSLAMLEHLDYLLSPSSFVTRSFLERGFPAQRIIRNVYPVDLAHFHPASGPRPRQRSLTVISTGMLSLRKGAPYLLAALRLVHRRQPTTRFLLTDSVQDNVRPMLAQYHDLPVAWAPTLPHPQLADRLRRADVFVLPSLEDGFARTVTEALACGLQVVTTPNCGASDFVTPGVNGEVVPIRDPLATAEAVLKCWERIQHDPTPKMADLQQNLSFETFARDFVSQLNALGLL